MSIGDKPVISAQQAQQAAAVAHQIGAAAAEASTAIAAVPGTYSTKTIALRVLGGLGTAAGIVVAALTLPVGAAIATGIGLASTYLIGLHQPSPAAVSNFGASAK